MDETRAFGGQVALETRDDDKQVISGVAAVFYRKDTPGSQFELAPGIVERIMPTAFDRALEGTGSVVGVFNHDDNQLLGRTDNGTMRLTKTKRGLNYEIDVDMSDPDHQRMVAKLRRGDVRGSSFKFSLDPSGEKWARDGDSEVRELHDVSLFDVGPVTNPAYTATSSGVRSEWRSSHEGWKEAERQKAEAEEAEATAKREADEAAEKARVECLNNEMKLREISTRL